MKVRCLSKSLTDDQRLSLGISGPARPRYQITVGAIYIVFSMSLAQKSDYFGSCPFVDVIDDGARLIPIPLCLFEIVDGRPSKYWEISSDNECNLRIWPKEF